MGALGIGLTIPLGGACRAQALLFPNGESHPGELGGPLAGAHTALAGGAEAGWYNPAGYAVDAAPTLMAGVTPVAWQRARLGAGDDEAVGFGPGYLAFNDASGGLGYGWQVHWPLARDVAVRRSGQDAITAGDVPVPVDPGGLDGFADGIERRLEADSRGRLEVLNTSVGIGVAVASWLRLGVAVQVERVTFAQQGTTRTLLDAEGDSGESYAAAIVTRTDYRGVADRWGARLGLQVDLGPGMVLGLGVRLPTRELGGRGEAHYSQDSHATLISPGGGDIHLSDRVTGDAGGLDFTLRRPLEVRAGIGLFSETAAFSLDVIRSDGLPAYTVLPLPAADATSTLAVEPPRYRTGLEPVWRWAAGASVALGSRNALLFGLSDEGSAVPGGDAVFRRIDLHSAASGWLFGGERFSGSVALVYLFGEASRMSVPSGLGDERERLPAGYDRVSLTLTSTVAL